MTPILFTWIPKNAGSSFYSLMKERRGMSLYLDNFHHFTNKSSVTFGHVDVRLLINMKIISKEYWDKAIKVAIIRNPYSRFISLYQDFLRSKRLAPDTTPKEFAHVLRHYSRAPGMYNVLDYSQCASQVSWLLPGVRLLRFEYLQEDVAGVFGNDYIVPHENSSDVEWREFYDDELREMVYDLYYESFVLLNYKKEI